MREGAGRPPKTKPTGQEIIQEMKAGVEKDGVTLGGGKRKGAKPDNEDEVESRNLFNPKKFWKNASKRDRKAFLEWIQTTNPKMSTGNATSETKKGFGWRP